VCTTLIPFTDPEGTRSAEHNEWKADALFSQANWSYWVSVAMSITNRYRTSLFSVRSWASLMFAMSISSTVATKSHTKSARLLQRSLGRGQKDSGASNRAEHFADAHTHSIKRYNA
jgi:hypothetical protein